MIQHRILHTIPLPTFASEFGGLGRTFDSMSGFRNDAFGGMKREEFPTVAGEKIIGMDESKQNDKPKRPLSAYNFFFQNERRTLLQEIPTRKEGKPRRSHGKIGFADLARSVAAKWRNLSDVDRAFFDDMAANDKERYRKEMEQWKKMQSAAKRSAQPTGFEMIEQSHDTLASIFNEVPSMRDHPGISYLSSSVGEESKTTHNNMSGEPYSLAELFESQMVEARQQVETQQHNDAIQNVQELADLASRLGEEGTEYFLNLFRP